MIQSIDPQRMIVDRSTTLSTTSHEILILMLIVESLSMKDTIVVGFTHLVNIEMPVVADIL